MNAPAPMFQYNQDSGVKAGTSDYINESGAYVGKISAKWAHGTEPSKSEAIEFSLSAPEGKANFLSVWYKKKDGTDSPSGIAMINAIMGITRISSLTPILNGKDYVFPELEGKEIGFVLQKVLTTKQNLDDSYKFDIKIPFHPQSRQTLKELVDKSSPVAVKEILETLKDRDERKKKNHECADMNQQQSQYQDDGLDNVGW